MLVTPLLGLIAACSGGGSNTVPAQTSGDQPPEFGDLVSLKIDVYPTDSRENDGAVSVFRALPQTLHAMDIPLGNTLEVGIVRMRTPQEQRGSVRGFLLNPLIASVPGEQVEIDGTVFIGQPDTVQSYASTITSGAFSTWVVPSNEPYQFAVVPDDPLLPLFSQEVTLKGVLNPLVVDVDTGVPVYGQVTSPGGPLGGARVAVVDSMGHRSATATTDAQGLYLIRVHPGQYKIVCEGRDQGQDPTLRVPVTVEDPGLNWDIAYPVPLVQVLAEGRVVSERADPVPGTVVRFRSEELSGYSGVEASWTWDAPTATNGTFIARVAPGTYTIDLLPPPVEAGAQYSPARLRAVRVLDTDGEDLGSISIASSVDVVGVAQDSAGTPLASAVVDCTEIGFDRRSFFSTTNDDGVFQALLPAVPLSCVVAPPGDRNDLATGRFALDPSKELTPTFRLSGGTEIVGSVILSAAPEALALVEVRDLDNVLLGYGLTDEAGVFRLRADLEGARILQGMGTSAP